MQVADDRLSEYQVPTTRLATSRGKRPHSLCEPGTDVACNKEGAELLRQLMASHNGALLADQMGLGKTHTVLFLLWRLLEEGVISRDMPALVVTPPRLHQQWQAEAQKWAPLHKWQSLQAALTTVDSHSLIPASATTSFRPAVHLMTYQCFTNPISFADISTYNYRVVVFDEARGLEDPGSRTAQHLQHLRMYVGAQPRLRDMQLFVLAVLGTPFGGNLANAANLLSILDPDRPVAPLVREVAAAFDALMVRRPLVVQCTVRRTLVYVPLSQQQRKAYASTLRSALSEGLSQRHSMSLASRKMNRICQFAHRTGAAELPY